MSPPIRVLHLEDSPRDAEAIRHKLEVEGLSCDIFLTNSKESFEAALAQEPFDLIISDYNLPGYDGVTALRQAQQSQPEVPVILISGTVGEEIAVKVLQFGATDYLLKARLERLAPAVERAIREAETQRTRRRAEAALVQSETRKAAILDSVLDCIVTMDAEGTVIEFNAAAERTFGYTKTAAIGHTLADLIIPPRLRGAHTAGLAHYLATSEGPLLGQLIQVTAVRADGSEIPVELTITAIQSDKAPIFTGVLRDITARKHAEVTRNRLAAIVDASDDAIFSMAMDDSILTWNAGAERLYGYAASEMIGRSRALLVPAEKHAELTPIMARAARGEAGEPLETQRTRKDGSVVDVSVVISPIADPTGRVTSVSTISRDITQRKAAAVASSRLAAIVESSDDAVISNDLTGLVTSWNRAAETMFGFTADEMIGTYLKRLIPADREDEHRQIIEQITRGERVRHFETRRQTKNGLLIDVSITVSPIKDATGAVIGVSKVARDITEHKRAEDIVRQTPGRVARNLRSQAGLDLVILAIATAAIYLLAARFHWFEDIAHWALAHEFNELPETIISVLFTTAGLLVFGVRRWRETESELASRQQMQAALRLLHDELDRRVKQRTDELSNANQALRREMAERRQTDEALRTAEERMRFALESANVGIWDMDYATGVLKCSEILETQCGFQPGTFGGTFEALNARIHPDDLESMLETIGKAMKSGSDFTDLHRTIWPDGTVRWLSGAGRIHLGEHGEPVRGIGISMDVTASHLLEEQYQQAQKMEAIGRLAGGVAHDFNNLLTVILGSCELLLLDLTPDDPRREDVTEIQTSGKRAAGLTRQLLAFSRKEIIEPTLLDLSAVVADMQAMLGRLIGEDVTVVLGLAPAPAPVKADYGQLQQIVMNLALNARDAMPGGGILTIETDNVELDDSYSTTHFSATPGRYVTLTVTDTGTGMTPEVQAHLFEPFFTTKEVDKGTGLGLATVHGIVTRSGGSIQVYSEIGEGTSFTVYFPRAGAAEADAAAPPSIPRPRTGTETVLVIDDAGQLRDLTKRLLQRQGYTALVAANATEALQLFEANPSITVLLTDVVMPGTSGPDLSRQLMEQRPGLKVIYMSGYTEDAIVHHGVLDPGIAFIHKPFSSDALGRKIRDVLDR